MVMSPSSLYYYQHRVYLNDWLVVLLQCDQWMMDMLHATNVHMTNNSAAAAYLLISSWCIVVIAIAVVVVITIIVVVMPSCDTALSNLEASIVFGVSSYFLFSFPFHTTTSSSTQHHLTPFAKISAIINSHIHHKYIKLQTSYLFTPQ